MTRAAAAWPTTPPAARPTGRTGRFLRRLVTPANGLRLVSLIVVGTVWELLGRAQPLFASYPSAIWEAALAVFVPRVLPAFGTTLTALTVGLLIATPVGMIAGFSMGRIRIVDIILTPYMNAIYATPRIALIPVLVMWLGLDFALRVTVVFLGAVFPIIINTYAGAKHVDPELLDTGRAFMASDSQTLRTIVLPSSLPYFFAGLRIGIARGVSGVIVAEMTAALTGIGRLLIVFADFLKTAELYVGIMLLGFFSLLIFKGVAILQQRMSPWSDVEGVR